MKNTMVFIALRTFFGIGKRLPLGFTRAIGRVASGVALRVVEREKRNIRANLEIAYPDLSQQQRTTLMLGCARHFGDLLAEAAWLSRATGAEVEAICSVDGLEHINHALDEGRGVVFATAHCGNWELLSARLPIAGIPLTSAVRQLDDPRVDALLRSLRCRFGTEIIPRGPSAGRRLFRALRNNRTIGLLIDQDIKKVPGVFVPFFGRPAWTPSGAATLAIRLDCPVVPGFIHRRPDGTHHTVIHPPLPTPNTGTLEDQVLELTAAATSAIEDQIRAYPEQWVWMHRRWRTRPSADVETQG